MGKEMKRIIKTASFMIFGFSCGALGQYGYYADFMENLLLVLILLVASVVVFILVSEDES